MITQEQLKEVLSYDPETGVFVWKTNYHSNLNGTICGCSNGEGYIYISLKSKMYLAHRLVWLYSHGYFPENCIDHIDRDVSNNRISNLREVTLSCNARNTGNSSANTSGVKGVSWSNTYKKWQASIKISQKHIGLGMREDFGEAVCLRLAAEQAEGWEGCDSSSPAYKYVKEMIPSIN